MIKDDDERWNSIVKSFKDYDVYYLLEYSKAFKIHGDGEPVLIYYEDSHMKAINVVMKRDISKDLNFVGKIPTRTYYDLVTPYGYGGFLVEGEASEESIRSLDGEYCDMCKAEGIVSEFVRFHPVLDNCEIVEGIYNVSRLGKTITMKLETKEIIWKNLSSKNRNMVRKAYKSGVEIYWGRNPGLFDDFETLYNATMDKDNAKDYYYFQRDFYRSVLNDLKYNSLMFYAMYEGKKIAMTLVLYSNSQVHYHLSASDRSYQHLAPTNLLLYEAACWGCENSFTTFHLGGGLGSREDNLYKFKKVFNENSNTSFKIGRKIFSEETYRKLLSIRLCEETCSDFFPEYRC